MRQNKATLHSFSYFLIIEYFLGQEWLGRYILPETAKRRSFLFPNLETNGRNGVWLVDVLQLADCLYNLQGVSGFDAAILPMMGGDIESTMSVLIAGKLLKQAGRTFKFVQPVGVLGQDYDIALMYSPDQIAMLEVKCKTRATEKGYNTIINTLNQGMKQLPADLPGIIFTQVPEAWIDLIDGDWRLTGEVFRAIGDFMRNSSRVVRLIFYSTFIVQGEATLTVDHGFGEIANPQSKFIGPDWTVFNSLSEGSMQRNWDSVEKYPQEAFVE